MTKEAAVPSREIDRAIERMHEFLAAPDKHTYREPAAEDDNEDDE